MTFFDPDAVERRLRRLDPGEWDSFVEGLWRARGYRTDREGDVIVATRDGRSTRLYPAHGRRSGPPDRSVDLVVAQSRRPSERPATPGDGTRVVDAGGLVEMLLYAVDRPAATRLCERHLGARPEELGRSRIEQAWNRVPSADSSVVTFAVTAVVLVTLVAVAGFALEGTPGQGTDPPRPADAAPSVGSLETGTAAAPVGVRSDGSLPPVDAVPGLDSGGIANLSALATAHDRSLEGRSHTLWLDAYRPRGGDPDADRVELDTDVAVAGGRYLVEVTRRQHEFRRPLGAAYRDGTDWYVADFTVANGTYRRVPAAGGPPTVVPDPSTDATATPTTLNRDLVVRYLASPETSVTGEVNDGGRTYYRVVGRGAPAEVAAGTLREYSFVALVDGRGFVVEASVEYTVVTAGGAYPGRFEWRYGRLDATEVEPPTWYERRFAENATAPGTASDR